MTFRFDDSSKRNEYKKIVLYSLVVSVIKKTVQMNTYAHRPLRFTESSGNIHWLLFSLIIYSIYQCLNSILAIIRIFF